MGQCLYLKKGDYPIKVITSIKDKATGVTEDIVSNWKDFRVISEIALAPSSGTLTHNDAYDEIIIGQAPTKVHFDSTMVFTDMKLPEYKVKRDLDGDGTFDKSDITIFSHQFREPKIQSIYYTLPSVNNLVYQIDLRVLQNEVPICTITTEQSKTSGTKYHITTSFDNNQTRINSYMYRIKDLHTNKFVATIPNKRESFDYDFTSKGDYVIYLDYVTEDNKKGQCESDTMTVGASSFDVNYTLKYQGPHDTSRQALEATGTVSKQNNGIMINALPAKLLLDINHITPQTPTTNLTVKLDNQIIQSPNGKAFEIPLYNNTHRILTISVYDSSTQSTSLIELPLHITQETILGKLTAFPNTVGNSPFEVTLDASTTTLTDKDDEIIYFTWDYGDGEIIKNSSQARTSHTYSYNEELDKGSYNPQVTVTTKKGKSASFGLAQPILVTKPSVEANISIDSHPAQIASVGDKVIFSLNTDGTPSQIVWDFGNNEKIECTDRSCTNNVPMFFTDPGTYTVNATITYKNLNTTNATTTIVIQQ